MLIRQKVGQPLNYDIILRPAELTGNEVVRISEIKKKINRLFIFEWVRKKNGTDILKAKFRKDIYTFIISRSLPV